MFEKDYLMIVEEHKIIEPFLWDEIADETLNEVFLITEQIEIKAFLAFGTCLGLIRDGGYIKGDNDLDIGIICEKRERKILANSLEENGFIAGRGKRRNHYAKRHFFKNDILVDIFFYLAGKFYSNFDYVQYKEEMYALPHPVEEYLSACYSNWKTKENETAHYYD